MCEYLLFRLYGSMASWGDIAVGEYRPSYDHPSKSAIIGLLSAAVGIRRDDDESLDKMVKHYAVAVKTIRSGVLLRDYHTVQVGRYKPFTRVVTRKQELEEERAEKINTILSSRDYYCDAIYVVCIWKLIDSPLIPLTELKEKLLKPEFVCYLGRKSCPPSAPFEPQIIEESSIRSAFEAAQFRFSFPKEFCASKTYRVYWEGDRNEGFEGEKIHSTVHRDVPLSRRRWQFDERHEHLAVIEQEE